MVFREKLSYSEAIKIVAKDDEKIARIDRVLGGVILGAAPFTGGLTLALIDPKTELIALLRQATGNAAGRIKGQAGRTHYELLEAAHTVLGLSAFFDAFRDEVGPRYRELQITEKEKGELASRLGNEGSTADSLSNEIARASLPLPSPVRGFAENVGLIREKYSDLGEATLRFVEKLLAWPRVFPEYNSNRFREAVVSRALSLYRDRYTRLATDIPELAFWAATDEHAATRAEVRQVALQIERTQEMNTDTLLALEERLASTVAARQVQDVERKLAAASSSILTKPLWRSDTPSPGLTFPIVLDGFISPRFRIAVSGKTSELTSEGWWGKQELRFDLAQFLANYIAHPESAHRPLVILGHPGAGKSLLTEIVAARLPPAAFTPVLVRLRRVDADAELHQQIETAVESTVKERISWGALCRESATTKVVMFDGFDELIQATGVTQSGYIEKVARFQSDEWDAGHSVITIVTSRTLVMDRTRVPEGSIVVRLEQFDDEQIARWVVAWNAANKRSEPDKNLEASQLMRLGDLARQPLLLALLAIYDAESGIDELVVSSDGSVSEATLYRKLLDSFIARQIKDKAKADISESEQRRQEAALRRDLALAAFAMFNRGRQFISEEDLARDLEAFSAGVYEPAVKGFAEPIGRAGRTVAAFFFVHVAQADAHARSGSRRTYEFLHATFGEYLVAEHICILLNELTQDWERARERLFTGRPDDAVFRALLSHQPITNRDPITVFAQDLIRDFSEDGR